MDCSLSKVSHLLLLLLLMCVTFKRTSATSQILRVWGHMGFVEYRPGSPETHLIVTSVHGGCMEGYTIPPRQHGCYDAVSDRCSWHHGCWPKSEANCTAIFTSDRCTVNLAVSIAEEWETLTGKKPHVVISHLERSKLDANRAKGEAAQGNPDAEQAWKNLHEYIVTAKRRVTENGVGLLVDIHGQGHAEEWVELGYGVPATLYDGQLLEPEFTYIQNALRMSNHSVDEVLRGEYSLGKYLEERGHISVPSPGNPSTNGGKYFSGGDLGFITWTHGSRLGGALDSILIENPMHLRTPQATVVYAEDFAAAVRSFAHANYGREEFD